MKFFKKSRKGFTLVELIVVIAIVAILAAVSVVSYIAFIHKGNESADIQLVKQLNIALSADEALNGTRPTMYEMLEGMEKQGFVVENLTKTKSGYDIVYDHENNRFGLVNGDNIVYCEPSFKNAKNLNVWVFADSQADIDAALNNKNSIYLTEEFPDNINEITVNTGIDTGKNRQITQINYINRDTTSSQTVVIRTSSYQTNLKVDAPLDIVKHYYRSGKVEILSTASSSYDEFGSVPFIKIYGGHLVFGETAETSIVYFKENNGEFKNDDGQTISVDVSSLKEENYPEFRRDNVNIKNEGTYVAKVTSSSDEYIWLWGTGVQSEMVVTNQSGAIAEDKGSGYVLKDGITAGTEDGTIADQLSNADQNGTGYTEEEIDEQMNEEISEKIVEENKEIAKESGICSHEDEDLEFIEYINEPTCEEGGDALYRCKNCGEVIYKELPALGHDLIGIYCNRCHHPVAFVDEIDEFTVNDPSNEPRMPIVDIFNQGLSGNALGNLYLDVAYSFKFFPNNDESVLEDQTKYSFNSSTGEFYKDNDGAFTAQIIYQFFSSWYCDFYVSFDKPVAQNSCGLGGYYETWGASLGFLAPQDIPGNHEIPLLGTMISGGQSNWTYEQIRNMVGEFKCGFFNLSEANANAKTIFTVKLRMINPTEGGGYNDQLGIDLPDHIDVAVTNYEIQAPSKENMDLVNNFLAS